MRGYTIKERKCACRACGDVFFIQQVGRVPLHCADCDAEYRILKGKICNKVMRAIRDGKIKRACESFCVDCKAEGKRVRAQVLEHRSYDRPLEVVPVCRTHNYLRGPATWTPGGKKTATARRKHRTKAAA